jgi:hypothetical protein
MAGGRRNATAVVVAHVEVSRGTLSTFEGGRPARHLATAEGIERSYRPCSERGHGRPFHTTAESIPPPKVMAYSCPLVTQRVETKAVWDRSHCLGNADAAPLSEALRNSRCDHSYAALEPLRHHRWLSTVHETGSVLIDRVGLLTTVEKGTSSPVAAGLPLDRRQHGSPRLPLNRSPRGGRAVNTTASKWHSPPELRSKPVPKHPAGSTSSHCDSRFTVKRRVAPEQPSSPFGVRWRSPGPARHATSWSSC